MRRVSMNSFNGFAAIVIAAILVALPAGAQGGSPNQPAAIKAGDNLVVENIPAVPANIAEKANQYGEFRAAGL